jgi:exopolysaccharide biosynthesis protein
MKKHLAKLTAFLIIFSCLTSAASAVGAGPYVYTNTRQVANNLTYTNTISWSSELGRQEAYALSLTGAGDAYPIIMACDTIYGSLAIGKMIEYAETQGKNVLAAVNTDFFSTKTGVPMGIVIENGVYKSSPEPDETRSAVAFNPDGTVYFSKSPQVTITLLNNGSTVDLTNSGQTVQLTHLNKHRNNIGGMYLFSSAFSSVSTRTSSAGWFVKFRILEGTPSVSGTMSLEVVETLTSDASVPIGDGYLVLSAADLSNMGGEYAKFKVGDQVTLTTECSDPNLVNAQWATGGGDILIDNFQITDSSAWDKAISNRNPRTAFGVKEDGTVISYVADGREADHSSGLTLKNLAEEMQAQGCKYAVNFDGGGSSAMSIRLPGYQTSAIVNVPSDGSSRKCSTYLLFVTDAVSDGLPKNLSLQNDGVLLLAGSSLDLSYYATDSGYRTVAAPIDISAVSSGLGSVSGLRYTAGPDAGLEQLLLSSASVGAEGYGNIHIITKPTGVWVTDQPGVIPDSTKSISKLNVQPGQTVQLTASASYYYRPVIMDSTAAMYSVSEDIGTISETGLLTVGPVSNVTGTLTVTVGGTKKDIAVTVSGFTDTIDHWAKQYINDLTADGVVTGVTATEYYPEASIKRGDFILMLYRAAGKPAVSAPATFTDIKPEDYYATAVAWAESSGIAQGTGSGVFNPQSPLTREQAFAFVYRALNALGISYEEGSETDLAAFEDVSGLSSWAVTPTATLTKMGIVSGSYGKINPAGELKRGEMAKILCTVLDLK